MILAADVKRAICAHYHLPDDALSSSSRAREIAWPRQVAITLTFLLTNHTKKQIGRLFGFDHSTVIHSIRAAEARRQKDQATFDAMRSVTKQLLIGPLV